MPVDCGEIGTPTGRLVSGVGASAVGVGASTSVGASRDVGGSSTLGASATGCHAGGSLAPRRLDIYLLAAALDEYVPRVMAFLRDLANKGAKHSMRPLSLTLTAPPDMDERKARAALDIWVDRLACYAQGSGVILLESKDRPKGARHWHGLALTMLPERYLVEMWLEHTPGALVEAQHIETISSACLPLGNAAMEKDIRRILSYAIDQHAGSEIISRNELGDRWLEALSIAWRTNGAGTAQMAARPPANTQHEATPKAKP